MDEKYRALVAHIAELGSVAVAFSGGVDSTFLLRVCADTLPGKTVAVTGVSASLAPQDLERVRDTARAFGVHLVEVATREQQDPRYQENTPERCYFCKSELFERIAEALPGLQVDCIVDGTNLSDLGEHRPGLRAADEQRIRSPLVECGLTKDDVRRYSRALGLEAWDRPASPCLASRVPYGTKVTPDVLDKIGRAEAVMAELGFRVYRVRHHGDLARIELGPDELLRGLELRDELCEGIRGAGYVHVTLDLAGYRRGNLIAAFRAAGARGVSP